MFLLETFYCTILLSLRKYCKDVLHVLFAEDTFQILTLSRVCALPPEDSGDRRPQIRTLNLCRCCPSSVNETKCEFLIQSLVNRCFYGQRDRYSCQSQPPIIVMRSNSEGKERSPGGESPPNCSNNVLLVCVKSDNKSCPDNLS